MTKEKMCTVYGITNMINNKTYVGVTCDSVEKRFGNHKCVSGKGGKSALHSDIRKYGIERFTFNVLEIITLDSIMHPNIYERRWIKKLNTIIPNGYNKNNHKKTLCGSEYIARKIYGKLCRNKGAAKILSKQIGIDSKKIHECLYGKDTFTQDELNAINAALGTSFEILNIKLETA